MRCRLRQHHKAQVPTQIKFWALSIMHNVLHSAYAGGKMIANPSVQHPHFTSLSTISLTTMSVLSQNRVENDISLQYSAIMSLPPNTFFLVYINIPLSLTYFHTYCLSFFPRLMLCSWHTCDCLSFFRFLKVMSLF